MPENLELKVKVQVINYETRSNTLGKEYATSDKRISLAEAQDILIEREKPCKEVLTVKYENMQISLTPEEFENSILL